MSRSKIEKAIKERQADFLKATKEVYDGYLTSIQDNLIELFPNCWGKIKEELNAGAGSELKGNFLAVHSSSALCVNNFVPFKAYHKKRSCRLPLGSTTYFGFDEEPEFETKLRTGLKLPNGEDRTPPHLDFYLENDKTIIGIESKFTEYFGIKKPNYLSKDRKTKEERNNLEPYRDQKTLDYLPEGFHDKIIEYYYHYNGASQHLHIAQLIKHSIGLLKKCRENGKEAVLVYLYWEPTNPTDNLFTNHRDEIVVFGEKMRQFEPNIKFIPLSYPKFWELCIDDKSLDDLLKEHIHKVRERYEFKIEF